MTICRICTPLCSHIIPDFKKGLQRMRRQWQHIFPIKAMSLLPNNLSFLVHITVVNKQLTKCKCANNGKNLKLHTIVVSILCYIIRHWSYPLLPSIKYNFGHNNENKLVLRFYRKVWVVGHRTILCPFHEEFTLTYFCESQCPYFIKQRMPSPSAKQLPHDLLHGLWLILL